MTFMQLAGFPAFQILGYATQPKAYHDTFARVISGNLKHTTVHFTRVVLTRSNILLLGLPSIDINGTSRYVLNTITITL
jgi:hypothetical protein